MQGSESTQHDAFVSRFIRSQDRVYAYIATVLPQRSDAEDVFQQTCLVLWKKWEQFDLDRDFTRWACGIAHNEIRSYLRKQARSVVLSEDVIDLLGQARLDSADMLDDRRQALAQCMDKLPSEQRVLLEQCYTGDQTIRTIAEQANRTPNSVYLLLRRLKRALFECVNKTMAADHGTKDHNAGAKSPITPRSASEGLA